jgi:ATP-dependent exoDNAse (exonuclease V) beta subunit
MMGRRLLMTSEAVTRRPMPPPMPRELILASAGTGKTHHIASRIIGLLAIGVEADTIFASTFTRKAAGEILDKVLTRLADAALDEGKARTLAGFATLPGFDPPRASPDDWLVVLRRTVGDLHRLNIGTLDSFFMRAATSFANELALPPGWSIADKPVSDRVLSEALDDVLTAGDPTAALELARGVTGHDSARGVHSGMLRDAARLLDIHYATDEAERDPWGALDAHLDPEPTDPAEQRMQLAEALSVVPIPLTKQGEPKKRWLTEIAKTVAGLRAGDWDALVCSTLCKRAVEEAGEYAGSSVEPAVSALFIEACLLARGVLGRRLVTRGRAMGRLASMLAEAADRRSHAIGAYSFADVTRLLGGPDPLGTRDDLYYRLDASAQHILLDEFQDTSFAQWEALEPLIEELHAGYETERASVIVADPKQSIYAWRGGEPLLVEHLRAAYDLGGEPLSTSYRSSKVVLDFVNRIFSDIDGNQSLAGDPVAAAVAARWKNAFTIHRAGKDLAGHVRITVGPGDEGRGTSRPNLCRRAAELVSELKAQAPGVSIGVLTRRNQTVARIMMHLREMGVTASGEGGNPLTDSAAAGAVLALLRMAEHPGDTISRYHVAHSPVGEVHGFTDRNDASAANRLAGNIRRKLATTGYGATLADLAARIRGFCDARERRRVDQLVEVAYRYDTRAAPRISDFLRLIESERVEDPTSADVRVMTLYKAKGLEFDIVVLPELDEDLAKGMAAPLAYRPAPAARVTKAFPYVKADIRALFPDVPELHAAAEEAHAGRVRDGLSALYVGLTRARHALHIIIKPDGERGMGRSCTGAAVLRHALGKTDPIVEGDVLFDDGNPAWHLAHAPGTAPGDPHEPGAAIDGPLPVKLRPDAPRSRGFVRRTPSDLAGGSRVKLRDLLSIEQGAASEGTIAHAWLEQIGWIEDGEPPEAELKSIATRVEPLVSAERIQQLLARYESWLAAPDIRRALSRAAYPDGSTLEREPRFIHRDAGTILEGAIDRLVLVKDGDRVAGAEILDFKTDARTDGAALRAKADYYRPQLDAYRRAVAARHRLPIESVTCKLVMLEAGAVIDV